MRIQEEIQVKKAVDEHRRTKKELIMSQRANYQASNKTRMGVGVPVIQPTGTNNRFINNSKHFLIISLNTNGLHLSIKRL